MVYNEDEGVGDGDDNVDDDGVDNEDEEVDVFPTASIDDFHLVTCSFMQPDGRSSTETRICAQDMTMLGGMTMTMLARMIMIMMRMMIITIMFL